MIRTDRVGDVVTMTPLIRALRQRFPKAYLAALVSPYAAPVLTASPYLDAVLTDDAAGADAGVDGLRRQVDALRAHRFDGSLLIWPSERLARLTVRAGIGRRWMTGHKLYGFLTGQRPVSRDKQRSRRHEVDYTLDLGRALGLDIPTPTPPDALKPELFLTEAEWDTAERVVKVIAPRTPRIILHPTGGGSAPNWPLERYVQLVPLVARFGDVIVTGAPDEAATLAHAFRDTAAVVQAGRTDLRALMGLIAVSSVVVSASTGPMHLAAGLGVATVSLFCREPGRAAERWGPVGNRHRILLPPAERCPSCHAGGEANCTLAIPVPAVAQAVEAVLAEVMADAKPVVPDEPPPPEFPLTILNTGRG